MGMTTVQGERRRYGVQSTLYGTSNSVHRLYYGGVYLSSTGEQGETGASASTMLETIRRADRRAEEIGLEVE
jgi:hypothetical protein